MIGKKKYSPSYKGMPLSLTPSVKLSGGRNIVATELPYQEVQIIEDVGNKTGVIKASAYFLGSNFEQKQQQFKDLFNEAGIGTFIHPTLGSFQVRSGAYSDNLSGFGGVSTFEFIIVKHPSISFEGLGLPSLLNKISEINELIGDNFFTRIQNTLESISSLQVQFTNTIRGVQDLVRRTLSTEFYNKFIADSEKIISNFGTLISNPKNLLIDIDSNIEFDNFNLRDSVQNIIRFDSEGDLENPFSDPLRVLFINKFALLISSNQYRSLQEAYELRKIFTDTVKFYFDLYDSKTASLLNELLNNVGFLVPNETLNLENTIYDRPINIISALFEKRKSLDNLDLVLSQNNLEDLFLIQNKELYL